MAGRCPWKVEGFRFALSHQVLLIAIRCWRAEIGFIKSDIVNSPHRIRKVFGITHRVIANQTRLADACASAPRSYLANSLQRVLMVKVD